MVHEIKLREDYVEPVLSGKKNFEVRLNDRGYQKGDLVRFKAVSRKGVAYVSPALEQTAFEITYVHSGLGLKEGYVVLSIKEPTEKIAINPTQAEKARMTYANNKTTSIHK